MSEVSVIKECLGGFLFVAISLIFAAIAMKRLFGLIPDAASNKLLFMANMLTMISSICWIVVGADTFGEAIQAAGSVAITVVFTAHAVASELK